MKNIEIRIHLGRLMAAFLLAQIAGPAHAGFFTDARTGIRQFERDKTAAVGRNDVSALEHFLSEDWTIVSGEGSIITRSTFLQVMAGGDLVHQSMDPQDQTIRLYGDVAVVTAHIQSGGSFKGNSFHADEINTDVLVKRHGHWVCVLTQLTTVAAK